MIVTEKDKRGGKRPGSGRKPGTPNKASKPLKLLAETYTQEAIETLVNIMRDPGAPHAARVAAIGMLLDRGHGKPAIAVEAVVGVITTPERLDEIYRKGMEKQREYVLIEQERQEKYKD